MLSKTELHYLLALLRVPNLGDISIKKLLDHVGSAEGVFKEKKQNLLKVDGIGLSKLKFLNKKKQFNAAEEELRFIEKNKISYSYFKDQDFPERLKHCLDGPILIFNRGRINLLDKKIISVVGTRRITKSGRSFCEKLIKELSPLNPVIVSGFAYGVDITAHKAAIQHNLQTVACLAHGFDQIYPKEHTKYISEIESNGGFITEFWSSDPFERNNFLKRNRIIAGLSEATVVIESAEKGGSLVTADIANSYNREVFAVPGRPTDMMSIGCNNLIKSQQAHLLTSAADLIFHLGWELQPSFQESLQTRLFVELDPTEKAICEYLKETGKPDLDQIAINCEIPSSRMAAILLNLELKGFVRPLPGKRFSLI